MHAGLRPPHGVLSRYLFDFVCDFHCLTNLTRIIMGAVITTVSVLSLGLSCLDWIFHGNIVRPGQYALALLQILILTR